jgi:hypothetical protein
MSDPINPFQTTKPVEPEEVIGRDAQVDQLKNLALEGNNARLVAPRRFGKTSLLRRVQSELTDEKWTTVYVDLLGVVTMDDVARRIERAYIVSLKGTVARWFVGLQRTLHPMATLGGGPVPASASVDLSGGPQRGLTDRLELPAIVFAKTAKRVHVVFDEFQELDKIDGRPEAVIRSVIQHHGDAASYVFAGSQVHMMEMMFTDPTRAFFGQAQRVVLGPLDPLLLAEYVSDRFEENGKEIGTEALSALLDLTNCHPQRSMAAAHFLWDATEKLADLETWEIARTQLIESTEDECKAVWLDLNEGERRVLALVATGAKPYQRGGSSSRGNSIAHALGRLEDRGVLVEHEPAWRVVDPLLEDWVRRQR